MMGIERNFYCCLCRDKLPPEELHGIRFTHDGTFVKETARLTEHHLCQRCLDSAAELHREYEAMRPVRDAVENWET